jgi:hypothetical protein
MRTLLFVFILLIIGCSLDRWENPTAGNDVVVSEQEVTAETDQQGNDSSASSIQSTETIESTESTMSTDPTVTGTYPSTGTASTESTEEVVPPSFDWARVLITEIVTDPQQDHSDTAGGDGIPFNNIPGTGTVSVTDEYVEIFNGTEDVMDVGQWSLAMLDGSDETQILGNDVSNIFFDLGGTVEALGAGEFAVIGNPSGTLNNTITVELYNDLNELVDSVAVDDANASSLDDEAFTRMPDGSWGLTVATPGGFE